MKVEVPPGKYVIAVSGGVDSMVLLDILARQEKNELIVAHFDHGIRPESTTDAEFVREAAEKMHLSFYCKAGKLGANASEEQARQQRYKFLRKVQQDAGATAIITAHHQDDLMETAVINTIRGTGRKGMSSLSSKDGLLRPLLHVSKQEIKQYAADNHIEWREDASNQEDKYLRNYIRNNILSKISDAQRNKLVDLLDSSAKNNLAIDQLIADMITDNTINRDWFASLGHSESKEVLAAVLRKNNIQFDAKLIEILTVALKTRTNGAQLDVSGGWTFLLDRQDARLEAPK